MARSVNRLRLLASLAPIVVSPVAFGQEPRPCIDNPIQYERRPGLSSLSEGTVVTTEDMRDLGVVSVAEIVAQSSDQPRGVDTPGDRNQECGSGIEKVYGGMNWLLRECETGTELRVIRVDPSPGNTTPTQFTFLLRDSRCNLAVGPTLHPDAEATYAELRGLTETELDDLLREVSEGSE